MRMATSGDLSSPVASNHTRAATSPAKLDGRTAVPSGKVRAKRIACVRYTSSVRVQRVAAAAAAASPHASIAAIAAAKGESVGVGTGVETIARVVVRVAIRVSILFCR